MRKALLLLFTACAVDAGEPDHDYECLLIQSCGYTGDFVRFPFSGTAEEAQAFAEEWSDACSALTAREVRNRSCEFVLCGVQCLPIEGGPDGER